jgi:hypothetical protein
MRAGRGARSRTEPRRYRSEFTDAREGRAVKRQGRYATSFFTLAKVLSFSQVVISGSSFLLPVGVISSA